MLNEMIAGNRHNIWKRMIAACVACLFVFNTAFQGISYARPVNYSLAAGNLGFGQGVTEEDLEPFKGIVGDGEKIVYYGLYNSGSEEAVLTDVDGGKTVLTGVDGKPIRGTVLTDVDGVSILRSNGQPVIIPEGRTVHLGVVWSSKDRG